MKDEDAVRLLPKARSCARMFPKGASYDQDDLTQEALLRALVEDKRFDGRGDYDGFISQRMKHGIKDAIRRFTGSRHALVPKVISLEKQDPSYEEAAYDRPEDGDVLRSIAEVVSTLPPKARYAAQRHWFEGASLSQIGRECGVTEGAICQHIKEARRVIRHRVEAL